MSSSASSSKLLRLATFLREERVRAHERMRSAQRLLDDQDLELSASGRDTLEAIRRNAEEDFAGIIHLLAVWADKFKEGEEEEVVESSVTTGTRMPGMLMEAGIKKQKSDDTDDGSVGDHGLGMKMYA